MSFYFGEEDEKIHERVTIRLEIGLFRKLKSEKENLSAVIRKILRKHYGQELKNEVKK